MKVSAIRKMEEVSLRSEIKKAYEDLKTSSDQIRTGKEKDPKKSLKIKRNIARMLTVLQELSYKK